MELREAIRGRRSINFFDPQRSIPPEVLRELLELANLAPSSFNLQPWKVVVVQSPERKQALRRCAMDQPKAQEASAVLIITAAPEAVEEHMERVLQSWLQLGYIREEAREVYRKMAAELYGQPRSERRRLWAAKNAALFAMLLMLAAQALGLQTHPMDGFDEACLKREFHIPQEHVVPMLVAVGYPRPGLKLLPRAYRRPLEEFVRYE
jgi:nitroreductase